MGLLDGANAESTRRASDAALAESVGPVSDRVDTLEQALPKIIGLLSDLRNRIAAIETRAQPIGNKTAGGRVGQSLVSGLVVDGLPIATGTVAFCFQADVPDGWRVCDGTACRIIDYPELYGVIGGGFGAGGDGEFLLPAAADLGGALNAAGRWLIRV